MNIAKSALDDSAVKSDSDLPAIEELSRNVDTIKEAVKNLDDIKNSAEIVQQVNTNRNNIGLLKKDTAALNDSKISKFYASSQGDTNLPDSDAGRLVDLKLYGKSEQKQYIGYNTIKPYDDESGTESGVKWARKNGVLTMSGTCTTTGSVINIGVTTKAFDANKSKGIYETTGSFSKTVQYAFNAMIASDNNQYVVETGKNIRLYMYKGVDYTGTLAVALTDVSVSQTTFEPYVGGIPSPNHNYPQEIKSVVNPTMKVCGKNLWSGKNTEKYWMGNNVTVNADCISSDYIPIKGAKIIYAGFSYDWFVGFNCYDSKKNKIFGSEQQINSTQMNIENEYKIVPSKVKTPENAAFIKMMFSRHESKPYVSIVDGKYEPYREQTITLQIGRAHV